MLKQVRVAVKKETDGKQTPWYVTSIEGYFTFAKPRSEHDAVLN